MSRSKIFKGRPDRLLIDQRAILVKMPDFSDAPPLEEPEPDDFLYDEAFVIEEEEELEAAPLRVFIGTANISEIQEDNSLVESGAMVWDLSAMVESDDEDDFEMFDAFDDTPAAAQIQLGGPALVQTAVTPPAQAWALEEADEDIDLDALEDVPQASANISVGRVQIPLAIPAEQDTSSAESNLQIDANHDVDNDLDEDSDEDWGLFPDEPDDTPVVDIRAHQRMLEDSQKRSSIHIIGPNTPSRNQSQVERRIDRQKPGIPFGDAPDTDPIFQVAPDDEDSPEVTEKIPVSRFATVDLDEAPEPKSIQQTKGALDSDENIFREGYDIYAHELDLSESAPLVTPDLDDVDEDEAQLSTNSSRPVEGKGQDKLLWIVIALLFVAVLLTLVLK